MTRRLGGGRVGGAATSSVFGTHWQAAVNLVPASTSGATPVSFLLLTSTSVPQGFYMATAQLTLSGSASSTNIAAHVELDSVVFPSSVTLLQTGVIDGQFQIGVTLPVFLTAGIHTLESFFWKNSGTGSVTAQGAAFTLYRSA